ncbi:hypothetical protein EDB84DRAFT_1520409 [Lactarius hengduanensis]|nr:hypothetical protein EDB84DRAFT_1520409 [Lactarius hengduanensis]
MSYWLCSLPSRNTRTVLHGIISKTLRSYSQGRKATLGWAGGTKMLGRAAKSSSQSFAKPTFLSPILRTSPPSQLPRTRPPTEGTQLRMHSLHQTTYPTHYSTTMERRPWSRIPKPTLHLLVRRTQTLRVSAPRALPLPSLSAPVAVWTVLLPFLSQRFHVITTAATLEASPLRLRCLVAQTPPVMVVLLTTPPLRKRSA